MLEGGYLQILRQINSVSFIMGLTLFLYPIKQAFYVGFNMTYEFQVTRALFLHYYSSTQYTLDRKYLRAC